MSGLFSVLCRVLHWAPGPESEVRLEKTLVHVLAGLVFDNGAKPITNIDECRELKLRPDCRNYLAVRLLESLSETELTPQVVYDWIKSGDRNPVLMCLLFNTEYTFNVYLNDQQLCLKRKPEIEDVYIRYDERYNSFELVEPPVSNKAGYNIVHGSTTPRLAFTRVRVLVANGQEYSFTAAKNYKSCGVDLMRNPPRASEWLIYPFNFAGDVAVVVDDVGTWYTLKPTQERRDEQTAVFNNVGGSWAIPLLCIVSETGSNEAKAIKVARKRS